MHFFSNMNVIVCVVLLSVSINTVKGIYRIPINPRFRAHSDESDNTESELRIDTDNDNPQIERELNPININDTKKDDVDMRTETSPDLKFTDFVLEAAKVLKTYDNNVLEQAFAILDDELWKDVYKGCKSYELADIKKYASDKLGLLKDAPAETLRQHLDDIIDVFTNEDYGEIQDLVDYVNSLFVGESDKFVEVLLALVHRRISDDVNLADILKGALEYFLFDHYCNLDDIVRHELMKMIKHYWRQFISQVVKGKNGSNKETVPFVTPFIYEKDNEQLHKKRRFNKVNAGRPLALRFSDKSEPGENVLFGENENNMRANSKEISDESSNSTESKGDKEAAWDKSIYVRSNDSTEDHTVSKSPTTDKKIKNRHRGSHSTIADTDNIQSLPLKSKPTSVMRQSNKSNTIERLINIGNLAKEINNMIGPEGKNLRNGEYLMNWDSVFGMDFSGLMIGDEPSNTEVIKKEEGGNNKGVIITMKANYQE
ncbi:uncharacterized protein LOC134753245 [Cydia strobilella]|uniref:uncharacterized protein LOC134753245 n=1 Tax=Cydia strobilella TaxID=1100964 RepID=UPI003004AA31